MADQPPALSAVRQSGAHPAQPGFKTPAHPILAHKLTVLEIVSGGEEHL